MDGFRLLPRVLQRTGGATAAAIGIIRATLDTAFPVE